MSDWEEEETVNDGGFAPKTKTNGSYDRHNDNNHEDNDSNDRGFKDSGRRFGGNRNGDDNEQRRFGGNAGGSNRRFGDNGGGGNRRFGDNDGGSNRRFDDNDGGRNRRFGDNDGGRNRRFGDNDDEDNHRREGGSERNSRRRNADDGNDDNDGGFSRGGRGRNEGRNGGAGRTDWNNNKGGGDGERRRHDDEDGEEGEKKPREFYIPPDPTDNEDEIFNTGISTGINFSKYSDIPVKISGENIPPSINAFTDAGLRELLMENIRKSGYTVPTPIQKCAIPIIMAKRDLMGCAQTGSGKTAAFLLPIINSILNEGADLSIGRPQALIMSPTRELAIQIFNEARKFALGSYLKISLIYGGTSTKHQGENVAKGCHILICTPGRLMDFVNRGFITFEEIRFVVLDEADRMLDMGFRGTMENVMGHTTMRERNDRQTLMFSATFPDEIQELAGTYLMDYLFIAIGVLGGACTDIKQNIHEVNKFKKRNKLMEILQENADGTIVFVETKRGADFLASFLSETDHPTTSIHGDRMQRQREEALCDFKSGRMKVLIATSVAARGLDIKNVKHVVNYDMPKSIDEYVHRIGRTGRVGNKGRATSFFDPEADSALAPFLVKKLEEAGQEIPDFLMDYKHSSGGDCDADFGGHDMRRGVSTRETNGPSALEEDECWN